MSKVDDILEDELDPEDLDPTPRGGTNGRNTEPKKTAGKFLLFLAAVGLLGAAGCRLGNDSTSAERSACDEPASWCTAAAVQR